MEEIAFAIVRAIGNHPQQSSAKVAFSDPERLMEKFREVGVAARGFVLPEELVEIALVKNGNKLSAKTRNALASNADDIVESLSRMALSRDDPELAVRFLLGLDGVRLPTASCILSWILPHRWPVIDVRAWRAIAGFSDGILDSKPPGGLKVGHWKDYCKIVGLVATATGMTPQAVDVWLYFHDKLRGVVGAQLLSSTAES